MTYTRGNNKISAILIVRNEEKQIARCLESIKWTDEIVVIDQSSIDGTVDICRKYTDKIFIVPPKGYAEPDRPLAVSRASNEWILRMDADEVIPERLAAEMRSVVSSNTGCDSFCIREKAIFLDKELAGSELASVCSPRLFRRWHVIFSDEIETRPRPISSCGHLNNRLIHYLCENQDEYLYKINTFSSVKAAQAYAKGFRIIPKNRFWWFIVVPLSLSIRSYTVKMGFVDGYYGVLIAFMVFLRSFLTNAKIWEIGYNDSDRADSLW